MRKLSIAGGLLLALAAATSTMAATPALVSASTVTTLHWHAAFAKAPIAGSARLSGTSTYTTDAVVISARGIRRGAHITARLLERTRAGKVSTFAWITFTATPSSKGVETRTWRLTPVQRANLKAAVRAHDTLYLRLVDGSIVATGVFKAG
jgi:hypothetical protein